MGLFKKLFGEKKKISYQELTQTQVLLKQNTDCEEIEYSCSENMQLNANVSVNETKKESTSQKRQFPNSINELNKGELILLKTLQYTRIEQKDEIKMQSYFKYEYDMNPDDAPAYLQFFIKFNLLEPVDLQTTIQKHTIPQIKEILQTKSITVKGKKSDQIQALYDNFTIDELNAAFPPEYYVLSRIGKELLDNRLDQDDWNYRYSNIDFDEAKKAIDALVESKAYENTILYTNNPFKELPDYVSNNQEIFICTVMCINGWTSAKRILRRLFGIDDVLFYVEKYSAVLRSEEEIRMSKKTAKLLKDGYGKFYRIYSMNDEKTCSCCTDFNGKLLPINKAVIGVNYPPFINCSSEYCRCFAGSEIKKE